MSETSKSGGLVVAHRFGHGCKDPKCPVLLKGGLDALGHPVPPKRLDAAMTAVREMMPDVSTSEALETVRIFAKAVEEDQPAGLVGVEGPKGVNLDLTGRYRLLATLCTGDAQ